MIQKKLFETVLIEPVTHSCDSLHIVSGYASATMATRHYEELEKLKKNVHVNLIVGMCPIDGIVRNNHDLFRELVSDKYPTLFDCRYITKGKPVHSKVYVWMKGREPACAFIGSANYTQSAFFGRIEEVMTPCDPFLAHAYFKSVLSNATDCRDKSIESKIQIVEESTIIRRIMRSESGIIEALSEMATTAGLPSKKVSLLMKNGEMPPRSGLNWGMRPERGYAPEAYLSLPPDVYRSDFFPERGVHFLVLAENGTIPIVCSRGQKVEATSISTPSDNTEFGRYFREKLGVGLNKAITKEHLEKYGRADVDFYKIDNDTYIMDFSKP